MDVGFEDALYSKAVRDPGFALKLRDWQDLAIAGMMTSASVMTLISGSLNGKSHTAQKEISSIEVFSMLERVLTRLISTSVSSNRSVQINFEPRR
jgi:hypothetical protein